MTTTLNTVRRLGRQSTVFQLLRPLEPDGREDAYTDSVFDYVPTELEHHDARTGLRFPCSKNAGAPDCVGCTDDDPRQRSYYLDVLIDGQVCVLAVPMEVFKQLKMRHAHALNIGCPGPFGRLLEIHYIKSTADFLTVDLEYLQEIDEETHQVPREDRPIIHEAMLADYKAAAEAKKRN